MGDQRIPMFTKAITINKPLHLSLYVPNDEKILFDIVCAAPVSFVISGFMSIVLLLFLRISDIFPHTPTLILQGNYVDGICFCS